MYFDVFKRVIPSAILAVAAWALPLGAAPPEHAITIHSDSLALDQPRVQFEVFEPTDTGLVSRGPDPMAGTFLLDTGASGVFVSDTPKVRFDPDTLEVTESSALEQLRQNNVNMTAGTVEELGVGGTVTVDYSEPYTVRATTLDGGSSVQLPEVRMISQPGTDFGSFSGLMGMPAMMGRTTTLDMSVWSDGSLTTFMDVRLQADGMPPINRAKRQRFRVRTDMVSFDYDQPEAPTTAPVPFINGVTARRDGDEASGNFLFDTGAQMSMISPSVASRLGLDTDGDGEFTDETDTLLPVGGVGGQVDAPVLPLDSVTLPTEKGPQLRWTDTSVLVLDVHESIDGIIGSDFLTAGWLDALSGGDDGAVHRAHLDFRGHNPGLVFDVNLIPGDLNGDRKVNNADINPFVLALTDEQAFEEAFGFELDAVGDLNGDGRVNNLDINAFVDRLTTSEALRAVPEPTSAALVLLGGVTLFARGRRRHPPTRDRRGSYC